MLCNFEVNRLSFAFLTLMKLQYRNRRQGRTMDAVDGVWEATDDRSYGIGRKPGCGQLLFVKRTDNHSLSRGQTIVVCPEDRQL